MKFTYEDHIVVIIFPILDFIYEEDMDKYPLGACLAIALRLMNQSKDEKFKQIIFDYNYTA